MKDNFNELKMTLVFMGLSGEINQKCDNYYKLHEIISKITKELDNIDEKNVS